MSSGKGINKPSILLRTLLMAALAAALSACTIQAKITDLTSSGTFLYSLSGHSDFGTTSSTTYTSTKQSITITPTISGQISSFAVSPALPAGLTLNTTTGVITGRPTTPTLSANYVITGTASDGSSSTQTLTFEVAGYYLVNTTTDASDANAGDNICATAASQCALRAATQEAAAQTSGTLALIDLPAGTFTLAGSGLTISSRSILTGAGASSSTISGGGSIGPVVTSSGNEVVLDSVSISNGLLSTTANGSGAGIFSTSAIMQLKNCIVSNNNSTGGIATSGNGAGMLWAGSGTESLLISQCVFSNNTMTVTAAQGNGGAFANLSSSGTATITNSTFSSNSVSGSTISGFGGALYLSGKTNIYNTTISSNSVSSSGSMGGGGIRIVNNTNKMYFDGLTCTGNSGAVGSYGGCVYSSSRDLTIKNSSFSANLATVAGGIYVQSGQVELSNSSFSGASSNLLYIAILGLTGSSSIKNSTFSNTGNQSAVYLTSVTSYSFEIEHITIYHNNAAGNALQTSMGASGTLSIKSSIIQRASGTNSCNGVTNVTSLGYNVSPDATCTFFGGTDVQNSATIGLSALASNGGPTQTMAIGTGSSAYNLVPAVSCSLTTDQRGSARPNGGACDAGAYEY